MCMELHKKALDVCGRYSSGLGDLAKNHDRYLADDLEYGQNEKNSYKRA